MWHLMCVPGQPTPHKQNNQRSSSQARDPRGSSDVHLSQHPRLNASGAQLVSRPESPRHRGQGVLQLHSAELTLICDI